LEAQSTPWLVLAQQSWIQIVTDGEKVWITQQP
jgi:hypothetical protein